MKIIAFLSNEQKNVVLEFAKEYEDHPRKATKLRVDKIIKLCK